MLTVACFLLILVATPTSPQVGCGSGRLHSYGGVPCSLRRARERRERQSSSYPSRGWISSRGSSASAPTPLVSPAPYRPPSPPAPGRWRLSHYDAGIAKIAPLKTVLTRVRELQKETKYGTDFKRWASALDQGLGNNRQEKQLGIGASPGFIGGTDFSYVSNLATYSILHRYRQYLHLSSNKDHEEKATMAPSSYLRENCEDGCPPSSHCEWGQCECDEGFHRSWGSCAKSINEEPEERRSSNGTCATTTECWQTDINLVCRDGFCTCRDFTRWNDQALECQMYLSVDCTSLTYSSSPSPGLATAALILEQRRRGWTTEEDKEAKLVGICTHSNPCRCRPGIDCDSYKLKRLAPKVPEIASNRTETLDEALYGTLLSVITEPEIGNVSQDLLDEAFCRDVNSFSEVFLVDNYEHRPVSCPKLQSACAMLFDSSRCHGPSWRLLVPPGAQKELKYWSSDWKYRNDADLVAVRAGCTFTAWTEVAFEGDKMTLIAGSRDRWLVLADSPTFANFDENILSFQCQCRGE